MDWHGKQVLIVDDEAPTRWLLAILFRERGAEVHLAADAESGLRMAREHHPHLVILDILMPGMNGWEVLQVLRQTSDVPVVVLTSMSNGDSEARCLDAGADDHVAKPFDRDELLARCWAPVRRYLNLAVEPQAPAVPKPQPPGRNGVNHFAAWRTTG